MEKKKPPIHQISKEKIKIKSPVGSQEYRRILFFPTFISSMPNLAKCIFSAL
jgi:hypothetical protein